MILRQEASPLLVETRSLLGGGGGPSGASTHGAIHTVKERRDVRADETVAHPRHRGEARVEAADLESIHASLRSFLDAHRRVLELDYDKLTEQRFEVSHAQIDALKSILIRLEGTSSTPLAEWTEAVLKKPAWQLLGPAADFAAKLAERLGKRIVCEVDGEDELIDVVSMRPVMQTLPHLLRNAVDHGIEAPRERAHKPLEGRVAIRIRDAGDAHCISVEDDGRGIDVERLTSRALERGFFTEDQISAMDRSAKIELIFLDGLSSAEVTTHVSGRGIGMSAVKAAVQAASGTMEVWSESGRGTRIDIVVPKPSHVPLEWGAAGAEVRPS